MPVVQYCIDQVCYCMCMCRPLFDTSWNTLARMTPTGGAGLGNQVCMTAGLRYAPGALPAISLTYLSMVRSSQGGGMPVFTWLVSCPSKCSCLGNDSMFVAQTSYTQREGPRMQAEQCW
jgi:hypothetical protein